jgi:hypothetical protein
MPWPGQERTSVILVGLSAMVPADRARVWRALVDPGQAQRWRPGPLELLGADDDYPAPGRSVRWRFRLRRLPVVVSETVLVSELGERLELRLRIGLFRFDAVFTLAEAPGSRVATRVGLTIAARNQVPLVGGVLDRFAVRRLATELAAAHLEALRVFCQAEARRARRRRARSASPAALQPSGF